MKIPKFEVIPILIGLLLCQVQACKSSTKKGYVQINQKEYEEQIQGLIEAVHKEKELNDKLLEEREQNPISPVIQEEEMIFDMMEKQELPAESRESYILAERDDTVIKTGRAKYLPIDTCKSHGVGCDSKTNYLQISQQKRCSLTNGLLKAGVKLLDWSPGGFLVEMVKTIAKPIYNWMISTDNDPVMEIFTNRILPET